MNNQFKQDGCNLVLAVIQQAVKDLQFEGYKERAIVWFESGSSEPLTFRWYCDLINISPDWARRKIGMASRSGQDAPGSHKSGLR